MVKRQNIEAFVSQVAVQFHPQRVILFGSAASGRTNPDSDLDFLVIIPNGKKTDEVTNRLNMQIRNKPMPCDFIVTTPTAILKSQTKTGGIYQTAISEGKELYAVH